MDPKKKIYIFSAIFVIVNLALIILLLSPIINTIGEKSQELVSQKNELILLSEKGEKMKTLEKIYQTHQKDLEKIDTLFVDSETPIDFINFLEETTDNCQVSIKKELVSGNKEDTDFGPGLAFNISLDGSFPNFMKFLEKLESGPYLIEIPNLNIRRLGGNSLGNINATIPIKVLTK